jgi:hypothetical protein
MAGVYWRNLFICGLPSGEIYDDIKNLYINSAGLVHRSRPQVLAIVSQYVNRLKNDDGFFESEVTFNEK